jgi:hypothetical protein
VCNTQLVHFVLNLKHPRACECPAPLEWGRRRDGRNVREPLQLVHCDRTVGAASTARALARPVLLVHFAWPAGMAGALVGRILQLEFTVSTPPPRPHSALSIVKHVCACMLLNSQGQQCT